MKNSDLSQNLFKFVMQQNLFQKHFRYLQYLQFFEPCPIIPDVICSYSSVIVKFDSAARNESFEYVWFVDYERMHHSHIIKTRERGGYFKQKITNFVKRQIFCGKFLYAERKIFNKFTSH